VNDPFVLLPANLGPVVNVAANANSRLALSGVHIKLQDGSYEVAATDGKRLVVVTGAADANPLDFPTVPELAEAPPSANRAIIPGDAWKEAFGSIPRGGEARVKTVLGNVAVHLDAQESTLVTSDGEQVHVVRPANDQGAYPDYQAVLPKGAPQVTVHLDARLLAELLRVIREFTPDQTHRLAIEIHSPDRPLVLRTGNYAQKCVALLLPQISEG
jgi:DNA polymerase III sliding clamp (beta) subunit (PCNA family)